MSAHAQRLAHRERVARTSPDRRVVRRDHALGAVHDPDPGHDARAHRCRRSPTPPEGRAPRKGESGSSSNSTRSRGEQLSAAAVTLHVALAASGPGQGQLGVHLVESGRASTRGCLELAGGNVDRRGQNRHVTPRRTTGTRCNSRDACRPSGARLNVMAERPLSAVVLAAGEGTRMHSARPKPLHRICGRPMILHVLDALAELHVDRVVVVVGHHGEWVTKTLTENAPRGVEVDFVEQADLQRDR